MRDFVVGGALILRGDDLLLVRNRRRGGRVDWSTPGGVIDEGETMLEGLAREVNEETGLTILEWDRKSYEVMARAPGLGWHLRVEVHLVARFEGDLVIDDPDGIVEHAEWAAPPTVGERMAGTSQWVREPLLAWLGDRAKDFEPFCYEVEGDRQETIAVERVDRLR